MTKEDDKVVVSFAYQREIHLVGPAFLTLKYDGQSIESPGDGLNAGLVTLQKRLQHQFPIPRLLKRAVTHRSFSADHNERLEFLGDSVLGLAVADCCMSACRICPKAICRGSGPIWSSRTPCTNWPWPWACPR